MRIGIEAQRIFRKNKHGMDYVILEEIKQIQEINQHDDFFIFVKPGEDHCLEDTHNVHIIEVKCPTYPLWEQFALPKAAKQAAIDLLHCTSNTAPIFCNIPIILTLHDIIFLEPKDKSNKSLYQNLGWIYRRWDVPKILHKCKRIITVSDFEYNNIQKKINIGDKLIMIYNGYNEWFKQLDDKDEIYKKYISKNGYFFYFGNTDPKKNTERTLVAYSKYLKRSEIKRNLLLADLNEDYLDEILTKNKITSIKNNIIVSGYIKNKDLPYIYNNAFAFLYTSLRESFGIPLLEAMACGTPVITSKTSSMPEIAGKDAVLIDPESIEDIAESMLMLENNPSIYQDKKELGLNRAKMFSWKQTAKELLDVYRDVVNQY